jgi:hypothetical protein
MRIAHRRLGQLIRDGIAVMTLSIFLLSILPAPMRAGPFENFFKRVRHAMTAPEQKTSRVHRRAPPEESGEQKERGVHSPPNEVNTRSAQRATKSKSGKTDLPYATPVAGKKGFVTSPFAPNSGYIDVRDFPPGTEVKDPYTGKAFLTP